VSAAERLLFAAPMRLEARLVAGGARKAHVHRTGIGPRHAANAALELAGLPGDTLVVIGFCGALQGHLQPGEVVVADRVYAAADEDHAQGDFACAGAAELAEALAADGLQVHVAPVVCVSKLALGERREQLRLGGAAAVDMESVWLQAGAAGRPFAVVRIVLDTPQRELLRPQMIPLAFRAGGALRATAKALQALGARSGLRRLLSGGPQPVARGADHGSGGSEV
jgi:4-hydroxy-3-methylbut-2-en-1-yl diphosphate reductase